MSASTVSSAETSTSEPITYGFGSFTPAIQRFLIATVINMIGSGMIFAFLFIYLHDVRKFSGSTTGWIMGATPFAVVCFTPLAGSLSDRFGPRRVLTIGCVLSIVASMSFAFFSTVPFAVVASLAMGVANGLWYPSQSALLSVAVSQEMRPTMSAFQRSAVNLGAAGGGLLGGLIADKTSLTSFQWMFAINAATYLIFLSCLPGLPSGRVDQSTKTEGSAAKDPGFREVFRDRFYLLLLCSDIGIGLGFGFAFGLMPGYASRIGISERVVGLVFLVGAVSVVVFQMPMLRWVRGRQRMHALTFMNAMFAIGFMMMIATVNVKAGVAVFIIAAAQAVAGWGEAALAAVRQPLTSDLAPPVLIGRYFGLAAMVFQGAMGAASVIGGKLMDVSLTGVWIFATGASVYGVVMCLWLGRRIPASLRLSV